MDDLDKFLKFFKALGDKTRLQIVATLADGDCTVRQLAEMLDKKEPTISEHLAMLKEVGLVTMRAEGNFRIYSFNPQALNDINRELFSREQLAALASGALGSSNTSKLNGQDDDDLRTLQNYLDGERLITIPSVRKKLLVVLRWLTEQFEVGRRYSEKEVNAILTQHHEDYATLRREMIGYDLLRREKGIYWRPDTTLAETEQSHDE
jgi:biotin operon repressor